MGNSLHGLINRLVGNNQVLEVIAGLLNSLGKLIREQSIRDLRTLGHDRNPVRQLVVIPGESDASVVAVLTELPHVVLVHNSPDESIVGGVVDLQGRAIIGREGDNILLLSIEGVRGSLVGFRRGGPALKQEAQDSLRPESDGVVPLGELNGHVHERHVLTTGRVGGEFLSGAFLEERLGVGLSFAVAVAGAVETHNGELALQSGGVSLRPVARLAAVLARAPEVEEDN